MGNKHWFPVTGLLKNFRSHVARCTACSRENVECLFVHDSRKTKIRDQQICIVFWGSKQKVLRFQIPVYDAMVMKIGDGGESRSNKVCGVRFIVASFPTYSIEQFTAEGEVCY